MTRKGMYFEKEIKKTDAFELLKEHYLIYFSMLYIPKFLSKIKVHSDVRNLNGP